MGNTPAGHKSNASESSENVDWTEIMGFDIEKALGEEEPFPEYLCYTCKHSELDWEQDSWEEGGGWYQNWYCYAKNENGEDVCYHNEVDVLKDECPYYREG